MKIEDTSVANILSLDKSFKIEDNVHYAEKAFMINSVVKTTYRVVTTAMTDEQFASNEHIIAAATALSDVTGADFEASLGKKRLTPAGDVAGTGGTNKPNIPTVRKAVKSLTNLEEFARIVLHENKRSKCI